MLCVVAVVATLNDCYLAAAPNVRDTVTRVKVVMVAATVANIRSPCDD